MECKVGDKVNIGDDLVYIHANSKEQLEIAKNKICEIIKIGNEKVEKENVIIEII